MTETWLIILIGAVFAGAAGFVTYMQLDPACPTCRHRDWSKGVPPWRCRRCGETYRPRRTRRRHPSTHAMRVR